LCIVERAECAYFDALFSLGNRVFLLRYRSIPTFASSQNALEEYTEIEGIYGSAVWKILRLSAYLPLLHIYPVHDLTGVLFRGGGTC